MNANNPRDLSALTLAPYNRRAEACRAGPRDHDVSQNIAALLGYLRGIPPPYTRLDFGCGPGRDLATFRALGQVAIGLDGAARFVEMARAESGCEVWQQDFLRLGLPGAYFDGIFANAWLFHVPSAHLSRATVGRKPGRADGSQPG